jgi:sporulation protein YlmC with PRC-barrel domain
MLSKEDIMIRKYLATAILGTAIIGGAAFAQSTAPSTGASPVSAADNIKGSWRASKLVGLAVYNDANERLGDINEILVDKSGKINAVILGVGGFLGVGEQNVAVSFDQLKWVTEPVRSVSTSNPTGTGGIANPTTSGGSTVGSSTANNANANTTLSRDNWYPDHAVMSGTKDQLKAMPAFKYSDYNK